MHIHVLPFTLQPFETRREFGFDKPTRHHDRTRTDSVPPVIDYTRNCRFLTTPTSQRHNMILRNYFWGRSPSEARERTMNAAEITLTDMRLGIIGLYLCNSRTENWDMFY